MHHADYCTTYLSQGKMVLEKSKNMIMKESSQLLNVQIAEMCDIIPTKSA